MSVNSNLNSIFVFSKVDTHKNVQIVAKLRGSIYIYIYIYIYIFVYILSKILKQSDKNSKPIMLKSRYSNSSCMSAILSVISSLTN